ncbi:MAG: hypothetical protein R2799_01985 [Crocinitomicaceae bacterium]|nr:hypothetical protein [Crocinitomicaceae bacterium]
MERNLFYLIESIKADHRNKKRAKKPASTIDEALRSLGVAIRFKEAKPELVEK